MKELKQKGTIQMSEWIDCKQRMPRRNGEYLVAFYHPGYAEDPYVSCCGYNLPGWANTTWCDAEGNSWDDLIITHWMPRPAPPKKYKRGQFVTLKIPKFKSEEEEANWWDNNPGILKQFKTAAKNEIIGRGTLKKRAEKVQ